MKKILPFRIIASFALIMCAMIMNVNGQVPVVEVIQPNEPGIEWQVGTTHLISWTDNFTYPVRIDLVNYGTIVPVVTNISPSAVGSTYSWTIPVGTSAGIHYKIRVSSAACPGCYVDESNSEFSLVASESGSYIHVEQPNIPGITWKKGTTNLLSWIKNVPGKANIELLNDDLIASDNASYAGYAGGLWGAGTNGGSGFQPWLVEYSGTTGGIVDNPAGIGIIGMDNPSFHLESAPTSHIYTDRPFSAPMLVGSTFSFDLAFKTDNGGSGSKGIELYTAYTSIASPGIKIIDIKLTSGNIITINGSPMFNNYGVNVMKLHFEYFSINTLHVYGVGRDGIESFDQNIVISGAPDAVRFLAENMADMNNNRRIYFNNLKITTPDKLLASDVEGSSLHWNIASDIPLGNKFKIKVSSSTDVNLKDESDHYFTITTSGSGSITVLQPSLAGITWVRGNSYLISWNDDVTGAVDIKLFKGGVETLTIASNIVGSTYLWPIPIGTTTGSNYKIKVISHDDTSTNDISDHDFCIQASGSGELITVLQPNIPGINWIKGSSYLISWIDNVPGNVKIKLYKGGVSHSVLAENVVGTTYVWSVPNDASIIPGIDYKIRVSSQEDGSIEDYSDNNFTITANGSGSITVLQPNVSGITWVRGYSYLISWIDDVSGTMDIKLYKGGVLSSTIATDVVGSTYVWDIPIGTVLGADYTIKVSSHNDSGTFDESDNNFAIQVTPAGGTITVLQPNGGENWFQTLSYYISWDDNFPEPVDIDLVTGTGVFVSNIASDVVGSTYVWNTTGTPLGDYKVKITSTLDATLTDMSNAVFHLICLPLVNSVYPNPANQHITVKLDDTTSGSYILKITDRFNMEIIQKTILTDDNKEIIINTSDIPNGVYFLSIASDRSVETKKILIQH